MNVTTSNHQATGYCGPPDGACRPRRSLADAMTALAKAQHATPDEERHLYDPYIRWTGQGYEWGWVLRD